MLLYQEQPHFRLQLLMTRFLSPYPLGQTMSYYLHDSIKGLFKKLNNFQERNFVSNVGVSQGLGVLRKMVTDFLFLMIITPFERSLKECYSNLPTVALLLYTGLQTSLHVINDNQYSSAIYLQGQ